MTGIAEISLAVPRVLFDTSVFIDAADGALGKGSATQISAEEWYRAVSSVNYKFIHAISPFTVVELLTGIANGGPKYFAQKKVALRKLRSNFNTHVHLPYPFYFTLRELFGMTAPYPPELEDNFDSKMDVVLEADSLDDLTKIGFFDSLLASRANQETEYRKQAERIQSEGLILTRSKWVSDMLGVFGLEDRPEIRGLLEERLDACFYWDQLCYDKARNLNCDLRKVTKMLYDLSQLNYLAAEDLLFVTRDSKLASTVVQSKPATRILLWESFLQQCRN
jgi:hypothetical protein